MKIKIKSLKKKKKINNLEKVKYNNFKVRNFRIIIKHTFINKE